MLPQRGPGPAVRWYRPCGSYSGALCGGPDVCWSCGWGKFYHPGAFLDRVVERYGEEKVFAGAQKHQKPCFPLSGRIMVWPGTNTCRACGYEKGEHICDNPGHRMHSRDECPEIEKRRLAASLAEG